MFSTEKDPLTVKLCERLEVTKKNGHYKLEVINVWVLASLKIDALLLLVINFLFIETWGTHALPVSLAAVYGFPERRKSCVWLHPVNSDLCCKAFLFCVIRSLTLPLWQLLAKGDLCTLVQCTQFAPMKKQVMVPALQGSETPSTLSCGASSHDSEVTQHSPPQQQMLIDRGSADFWKIEFCNHCNDHGSKIMKYRLFPLSQFCWTKANHVKKPSTVLYGYWIF